MRQFERARRRGGARAGPVPAGTIEGSPGSVSATRRSAPGRSGTTASAASKTLARASRRSAMSIEIRLLRSPRGQARVGQASESERARDGDARPESDHWLCPPSARRTNATSTGPDLRPSPLLRFQSLPSLGHVLPDAALLLRPGVQRARGAGRAFACPRVEHDDVARTAGQDTGHDERYQIAHDLPPASNRAHCVLPAGGPVCAWAGSRSNRPHHPPPRVWNSATVSESRAACACTRVSSVCR